MNYLYFTITKSIKQKTVDWLYYFFYNCYTIIVCFLAIFSLILTKSNVILFKHQHLIVDILKTKTFDLDVTIPFGIIGALIIGVFIDYSKNITNTLIIDQYHFIKKKSPKIISSILFFAIFPIFFENKLWWLFSIFYFCGLILSIFHQTYFKVTITNSKKEFVKEINNKLKKKEINKEAHNRLLRKLNFTIDQNLINTDDSKTIIFNKEYYNRYYQLILETLKKSIKNDYIFQNQNQLYIDLENDEVVTIYHNLRNYEQIKKTYNEFVEFYQDTIPTLSESKLHKEVVFFNNISTMTQKFNFIFFEIFNPIKKNLLKSDEGILLLFNLILKISSHPKHNNDVFECLYQLIIRNPALVKQTIRHSPPHFLCDFIKFLTNKTIHGDEKSLELLQEIGAY